MHTIRRSIFPSLCYAALSILFAAVLTTVVGAADNSVSSTEQESKLLAVLRSDAPAAEKAMTCKKLAIYGSDQSVPELAKLLSDPHLSSWARIPLEVIPGPVAEAALRDAADSLEGQLLIGAINSIGVRQDAKAVTALTAHLKDSDSQVASAAAVALGKIGDDDATSALRAALPNVAGEVRSSVAEGLVLCAERRYLRNDNDSAIEIYDEIRSSNVPIQRIVEATRGAILARGDNGIKLLLETSRSPEEKLRQLALATAREFPGNQVDKALAEEIASAKPQRAALIIQVMADRPDTVVLAAILQAARQGDDAVRLSAIDALRRVGDASCVSTLLQIVSEEFADLGQAAKQTLAELPGSGVDSRIVAKLPKAQGADHAVLLDLVAQRRIDAVPEVVKALQNSDHVIRQSALVALGQTIPLEKLSLLVSAVTKPEHSQDIEIAKQALRAASVRMADREACAKQLAISLAGAPASTKTTILEILGEVGGDNALQTIHQSAMSNDDQQQDDGSRILGKWNSVDAAPSLLEVATTGPSGKYRIRALRGYIGLARKFPMPDQQRAVMCQKAMDIASRIDEQRLVLEVLKIHPSKEGLAIAIAAKQTPQLKSDAAKATAQIAQKLRKKGVDVSALMSGK